MISDGSAVPRIILADDHPIIRYGIRMAVESNRIATVVGEAGSPMELFDLLAKTPCDVVVTDFSMPDEQSRDGLYLVDRLMRMHPALPVVVITALRNPGLLSTLLHKGVKGLLEKEGNVSELGLGLRAVHMGREYISPSLRTLLANCKVDTHRNDFKLTPAEVEVLRLFAYEGLTSQRISERLNRSRKTISRHKRSAQAKLGLKTDQELLEYCRRIELDAGTGEVADGLQDQEENPAT